MTDAYCLVSFDSTHAAISAHRTLRAQMEAVMMPTLREISASCGISVRIPPEKAALARSLLPPEDGVFYLVENGTVRRLQD